MNHIHAMQSGHRQEKGTFALISLGCPKNLVDSERMAGLLGREGYRLVAEPEGADFVVVNTCGFIGDARRESATAIREMLRLKLRGRTRGVIVAGCLAERDRQSLLEEYPEIDQLVGVFARDQIAAAAGRLTAPDGDCVLPDPRRALFCPAPAQPLDDSGRLRITARHLAFLKIAEGCNRSCTFCSIPKMRGPYATKPIERVLAEAEELAADGVRELILVAQDTSYYGVDLYGRPRLAELLSRLDRLDGLEWIRVLYLYPQHIGDELIEVIAGARKVLPYLDLPLQHINDDILRRMRRGVSRAETERLLDRLRQRIKGLVLRTTMMAGFPGEREEQFQELLSFIRHWRFERLGAFAYSEEPDTPAAALDDQVPRQVRNRRRHELLATQQEIAFAWNQAQCGRSLDVLIDRAITGQSSAYLGRSYADAPEIDGAVYVTGEDLAPGQIVPCEIVAARGYDLIAVATGSEGREEGSGFRKGGDNAERISAANPGHEPRGREPVS
jgi:ribosomal protein S12 methylthiotransferase